MVLEVDECNLHGIDMLGITSHIPSNLSPLLASKTPSSSIGHGVLVQIDVLHILLNMHPQELLKLHHFQDIT